ncbi:hypothetical protein N7472_001669 [Penicillium cf. griseofulvum]|uniref:Uncharacterized protein n=1 Tax=Penicillium cf. griseofulvum TaxID=2972120 RepID=A0A9W9T102_9EURO|nr:hypothetical protein N7472_001669 [Penicillium cf. griseofulvum]
MSAPTGHTHVDNGSIEWHEATSKKGKPYRIGVRKAGTEAAPKPKAGEPDVGGIDVYWPPTNDPTWIDTPPPVQNIAAISRYYLNYTEGGFYQYILFFTNTQHYDYHFQDETGDTYRCNTFRNDDHYVQYNSSNPTITHVSAK